MYTVKNYRTKKELKADVAAGERVEIYSPGPFPAPRNGRVALEGPHYPEPHKWYADCDVESGCVVKVR